MNLLPKINIFIAASRRNSQLIGGRHDPVTAADCVDTAQSKCAAECSRMQQNRLNPGRSTPLTTSRTSRSARAGTRSYRTSRCRRASPHNPALPDAASAGLEGAPLCQRERARVQRRMPAHVLGAKRRVVIGAEPGWMWAVTHTSPCRAERLRHANARKGSEREERKERWDDLGYSCVGSATARRLPARMGTTPHVCPAASQK